MIITSKADLNWAVAEAAFCPEPPLSERRAIHESGAWRFIPGRLNGTIWAGHWEPVDFCGDPAASYRLEGRLCELGWFPTMQRGHWHKQAEWMVELLRFDLGGHPHTEKGQHTGRLIAMCLAVICALGVEFELVERWDQC